MDLTQHLYDGMTQYRFMTSSLQIGDSSESQLSGHATSWHFRSERGSRPQSKNISPPSEKSSFTILPSHNVKFNRVDNLSITVAENKSTVVKFLCKSSHQGGDTRKVFVGFLPRSLLNKTTTPQVSTKPGKVSDCIPEKLKEQNNKL